MAAPVVAILCSKDCWTIRLSDLDLWGWRLDKKTPTSCREVATAGFGRFFFGKVLNQPFPQKDKCNLQKKKSAFMHVVI